ncbi:hypothetical protein [Mycolicibacterium hodleri]|uniref:Uncharacterized protein n=1 Tax=Mycolicibacterium hodleri TaxID=49897 RepID=A0A502EH23_9MYCO|nr:hypothetical protein [Mycolicibacterium hodleri]TPG35631.1 hypothetical protein EAH80_05970 [Mycolicibacterium hodleri]
MSATSRYAVAGRRGCAVLAASSAVLHALMVGGTGNPVVAVLIVGMALACLYCARELWTAGSLRVWCIVAVMNLGMVAVHWSMPGHHHGQTVVAPGVTAMSTLMIVATAIAIIEAGIATAVLWVQTRRRAIMMASQPN